MKWTINSEILEKYNLSLDEFALLLFLTKNKDIKESINSLANKGYVIVPSNNPNHYIVGLSTVKIIQDILLDSDEFIENNKNRFNVLADKLREIFPKGNKTGTNYNWRGSTAEIARKLKNLVVKYNCKFTDEEAIEATKAYIASFNGDYRYMKLLKYFLLKTPINNNGDVEIESDFMTYLENKDAIEEHNGNWTVDLA